MRELEGFVDLNTIDSEKLKASALFFDKLSVIDIFPKEKMEPGLRNDIDFLANADYVDILGPSDILPLRVEKDEVDGRLIGYDVRFVAEKLEYRDGKTGKRVKALYDPESVSDYVVLSFASMINEEKLGRDVIPIRRGWKSPVTPSWMTDKYIFTAHKHEVMQVAMNYLPVPDPLSDWRDILEFKREMRDKAWHFRRFLHSMVNNKQTEAEVRDDLEWTVNEYTKAMKLHHLKAGNSFMEVYVIPIIELAEDLAKFNWSKIAKGALSVKKRQVELMEAEMKAPGRECAYVFEAQKRFGQPAMINDSAT